MKAISVFEYDVIDALSDGEKEALDRLRGPRGEKIFNVGWSEARATSFVGVVQLGSRIVQVLPKMHRTDLPAAECEREATANLLFLLSYTRRIEVTEPQIASLLRQKAPLSEILYWVFSRRLWDAVRREVLRGYVTIEDRLDVLKGRWLVAAQSRRPDGWRRDRFDMAYDEFTEDNLPNRLLSATVLRLSRWATWPETRSHLAQLRSVFADVVDVTPQPRDFPEAAQWMQRYRRRAGDGQWYRPLLKMAEMFWSGAGPQPSPGHLDAFAFMFDMSQLFEEFIAEFIRRELREVWQSQGLLLCSQSGTRYLLCGESGRNLFWLVPDIRFENGVGKTELIVDTKYKLLDAAAAKAGVAEADAYQMFAYKERYDCPRVILLYPQTSDTIVRDFKADANSTPWLEVRTVNLKANLRDRREREQLKDALVEILFKKEIRM